MENPFKSEPFISIWAKHFGHEKDILSFSCFSDLRFLKTKFLPIYINAGSTNTKGVDYTIVGGGLGNKVFLVYDVPDNDCISPPTVTGLKIIKTQQYPGFLIDLTKFSGFDDFLVKQFSKKTRYKFKTNKKRLESCFSIQHKMHSNAIDKKEYDALFSCFKKLLLKRFDNKKISNNNLDSKEWEFYKELGYQLILKNEAGLFVTYNGKTPIALSLLCFAGQRAIDVIRVFDIDFAKFRLGSISLNALVEWCFNHQMNHLDFSKGLFDYKERWSNQQYHFDYHIIYNPKKIISITLAAFVKNYFDLKQFLRKKEVNTYFHKLTHKFRIGHLRSEKKTDFKLIYVDNAEKVDHLLPIDLDKGYDFLKKPIYDLLYNKQKPIGHAQVYRSPEQQNHYYLRLDFHQ
ncbi:MAG: GNAT family N-acetyltransferase [Flavobacteriaceae bacterium]